MVFFIPENNFNKGLSKILNYYTSARQFRYNMQYNIPNEADDEVMINL